MINLVALFERAQKQRQKQTSSWLAGPTENLSSCAIPLGRANQVQRIFLKLLDLQEHSGKLECNAMAPTGGSCSCSCSSRESLSENDVMAPLLVAAAVASSSIAPPDFQTRRGATFISLRRRRRRRRREMCLGVNRRIGHRHSAGND